MRTNERGAVMLLAIYFSALAMLLLNATGLQRSLSELRAAQMHLRGQSAFWLAEAALDQALRDLRASPDGMIAGRACDVAYGEASYTVADLSAELQDERTVLLTRQIIARGAEGLNVAQIGARYTVPQELDGLQVTGTMQLLLRPLSETGGTFVPIRLRGDVALELPQTRRIYLDRRATIEGDILSPLADPEEAVYGDGDVEGDYISQDVPALPAPNLPAACRAAALEPLVFAAGEHEITDGAAGLDRSGSDRDRQIILCASSVVVDRDAVLRFRQPALIYVQAGDFTNRGEIRAAGSQNLAVAMVPGLDDPGTAGGVSLGKFEGSVYAPLSYIGSGVSAADGLMSMDELRALEDQISDLRDAHYLDNLPKPDWWSAPETTAIDRNRWRSQQNDLRYREIERLERELEQQAVAPERDLGYVVGKRVIINGVDLRLRRSSGHGPRVDTERLQYLDWQALPPTGG